MSRIPYQVIFVPCRYTIKLYSMLHKFFEKNTKPFICFQHINFVFATIDAIFYAYSI